MKYRALVIIINKETFKQRGISAIFEDREQAIDKIIEIENTVNSNMEFLKCSKVIPVVKCQCGNEIECIAFTNTCECGKDYNFCGDLLAPRRFWGEETGEHWTECY